MKKLLYTICQKLKMRVRGISLFYQILNISTGFTRLKLHVGYGIVLPNAFTPNGDGINDTIRPWYKCMSNIEISIYDTWGSLLYIETSDGDLTGWDGTINGKEAENGNYIIVVRAITLFGESIELNGPVALIR